MKFFAFCVILCLAAAHGALAAGVAVGLYAPDRYDGIPEMCLMPMDFGHCRAKVKRYYFDMRRMKCTMFYWGGCAGNINNFKSQDECNKVCLDAYEAVRDEEVAPNQIYSGRNSVGSNNKNTNNNNYNYSNNNSNVSNNNSSSSSAVNATNSAYKPYKNASNNKEKENNNSNSNNFDNDYDN